MTNTCFKFWTYCGTSMSVRPSVFSKKKHLEWLFLQLDNFCYSIHHHKKTFIVFFHILNNKTLSCQILTFGSAFCYHKLFFFSSLYILYFICRIHESFENKICVPFHIELAYNFQNIGHPIHNLVATIGHMGHLAAREEPISYALFLFRLPSTSIYHSHNLIRQRRYLQKNIYINMIWVAN